MRFRTTACACCGKPVPDAEMQGALSVPYPVYYSEETADQFVVTDDVCNWDDAHFFIRTCLYLPVIGHADIGFHFGIWTSASGESFDRYTASFEGNSQGSLDPWFGWFSCQLTGYPPTLNLETINYGRDNRLRPVTVIKPCDHPLYEEQQRGITLDRLNEIYEFAAQD